jgi:hypothetical protein
MLKRKSPLPLTFDHEQLIRFAFSAYTKYESTIRPFGGEDAFPINNRYTVGASTLFCSDHCA